MVKINLFSISVLKIVLLPVKLANVWICGKLRGIDGTEMSDNRMLIASIKALGFVIAIALAKDQKR